MKRMFLFCLASLIVNMAYATNLQPQINAIINKVDPTINMGIKILDLDTSEVLYERNAQQLLIPASNMKLYSEAAALLALGPDYQFQTQLSTDAPVIQQGVLNGNLYLTMPGDPSLTQFDLKNLLSALHHWHIKTIKGNIILVSQRQGIDPYASGVVPKDLAFGYGAALAPVVLDENRVTITINPSWKEGLPAFIEFTPKNAAIALENHIQTKRNSKGCGVSVKMNHDNVLVAQGCINMRQGAVQERLAIQNPLRYTEDTIKKLLSKAQINHMGNIMLGQRASKTFLLGSHHSKPITQLMADTLKPSDNLYADGLFLHAAAKLHGAPVNWPEAQTTIKQFLQAQTGIKLNQAILVDGSGLSRNDRLTAAQTVDLLQFLHGRFPLAYEYIAALPISGQDGTLQRRLRKPWQQGLVRAKTGSMTGVVSLSGYLYTANGHTLAFAMFINTRPGTKPNVSGQYRSMVDHLCDFLLRQKPDGHIITKSQHPQKRVAFQQQPSGADARRQQTYKWRRLEFALKKALHQEPVSILFQDHQLVIKDHGANINTMWSTISALHQKQSFSVALTSPNAPNNRSQGPFLVWAKNDASKGLRVWTLRD